MTAIGIILIIGGTWITQDAIASILYYIGRDNEKWYFNHAVRVIRGLIGIMFTVIGIILIGAGVDY
mgnify:CR=1 FL=1